MKETYFKLGTFTLTRQNPAGTGLRLPSRQPPSSDVSEVGTQDHSDTPHLLNLPTWKIIFAYAAVYVGWGTTYASIRIGIETVGPASFLGIRFLFAALLILPALITFSPLRSELLNASPKKISHSIIQGLLLLVGGLLPVAYSEKSIDSSITAIIIGCAPLFFAFFDRALNGTQISKATLYGFGFGIAGILTLGVSSLKQSHSSLDGSLPGILLVVVGSAIWSFGSVLSKKLNPVPNPVVHIFYQYLVTGVVLIALGFIFEGLSPLALQVAPTRFWVTLFYLTVFPSLLSYSAYIWLLRMEPSHRVSSYALVNPIVASIAGVIVLNEPITTPMLAALILVLTGTAIQFTSKTR